MRWLRPIARAALSGMLLASCRDPDAQVSLEDQVPEPGTVRVTRWEGRYEVFIEYEFPVAGRATRYFTHISDATKGRPRTEGAIAFRFRDSKGSELEFRDPAPARAGIHTPSIELPSAGVWNCDISIEDSGETVRVHLPDVVVHSSDEAALRAEAPVTSDGITLLKEQQWELELRTEPAKTQTFAEHRAFPGRVRPKRGHRVIVASPLTGRLSLPSTGTSIGVGDRVEIGAQLASIEPTFDGPQLLALDVSLSESKAEEVRAARAADIARSALARTETLRAVEAKSLREVEDAQNVLAAAEAAHMSATAARERYERARVDASSSPRPAGRDELVSGLLEITAPIAGTIVAAEGAPGEIVTPTRDLFTILDLSTVLVEVSIPEHAIATLEPEPAAWIELSGRSEEPIARIDLRWVHAGREVDERTRTILYYYTAENSGERLLSGAFVTVFVAAGREAASLVVPESALVDEDGRYVAFVQTQGESFEKRTLRLGKRGRGIVEVTSGVNEGERVVTTSPWLVRLASLSATIPSHSHDH
jgi:cobalt-zinc-cadmium efflux system membrane fusion protein